MPISLAYPSGEKEGTSFFRSNDFYLPFLRVKEGGAGGEDRHPVLAQVKRSFGIVARGNEKFLKDFKDFCVVTNFFFLSPL